MTYTPTVPQGNQQIAFTQPLIQANFGFLENSIGQEHNFNVSDATQTYHLQASMPNMADPGSLPASTNGLYYVSAGKPKFYNATQAGGLLLPASNAYIQFNGSGSTGSALNAGGNAIRAQYNINAGSSTHDSTGLYTITFNTALPSANYLVLVTGMRSTAGEVFGFVQSNGTYGSNQTTTFVKIGFESSGGTPRDVLMGSVFIFGA